MKSTTLGALNDEIGGEKLPQMRYIGRKYPGTHEIAVIGNHFGF